MAGSDGKFYHVPGIEKSCYCWIHSLVALLPSALLYPEYKKRGSFGNVRFLME
jgi:hypothetical protein